MTRRPATGTAPAVLRSGLAAGLAAVLAGGLLAAPAYADDPAAAAGDPRPSARPAGGAPAAVEVQRAPDGDLALVTATQGDLPADAVTPAASGPVAAALAHASAWAAGFGAGPSDLSVASVTSRPGGRTVVRVVQRIDGVPVRAGELVVVVAADGSLLTLSGGATARPSRWEWAVSPAAASRTAVAATADLGAVASIPGADGTAALEPGPPTHEVYDPSLTGSGGDGGRTAWAVSVRDRRDPTGGADVVVDAVTGRVLLVQPRGRAALDRVVCDGANTRQTFDQGLCRAAAAVRREGDPPVGATPTRDVDAAYESLGRTASLYARLGVDLTALVGYDARDGRGRQLRATVRYCPPKDVDSCPMVNAFWLDDGEGTLPYRGGAMYLGAGLAGADDVVAHEITHGVTSATSRLVYSEEPGAINESMSDVFGELLDQSIADPGENAADEALWLLGEGLPIGAVRSMADPTRSYLGQPRQPDRMGSPLWWTSDEDQGGVHVNSGVGNKAAYLIAAGGQFNGLSVRGLGVDKTLALYWEVQNRLAPGTTYAVLGGQLRQACDELVAAGVAGLTADDCAQVSAAVDATELTQRRVVTAAATPRVRYGSRTSVSVQVTDAVAVGALRGQPAATVKLDQRPVGTATWRYLATRTADADGLATFPVAPKRSMEYRARVVAAGPWSRAGSAGVRVSVVPKVAAVAARPTVPLRGTVVVTGSSWPKKAGAPVLLQRRTATGWRTVARGTLTSTARFRLTWRDSVRGRSVLRVVRPATGGLLAGAGPWLTVRAR